MHILYIKKFLHLPYLYLLVFLSISIMLAGMHTTATTIKGAKNAIIIYEMF